MTRATTASALGWRVNRKQHGAVGIADVRIRCNTSKHDCVCDPLTPVLTSTSVGVSKASRRTKDTPLPITDTALAQVVSSCRRWHTCTSLARGGVMHDTHARVQGSTTYDAHDSDNGRRRRGEPTQALQACRCQLQQHAAVGRLGGRGGFVNHRVQPERHDLHGLVRGGGCVSTSQGLAASPLKRACRDDASEHANMQQACRTCELMSFPNWIRSCVRTSRVTSFMVWLWNALTAAC